jgi:uncharacterized protein YcbX
VFVQELWRYPIKSMRGERLQSVRLRSDGIEGDRRVLVVRGDRVITSRTHPRLLALAGTVDDLGEPLVDGLPWNAAEVARRIQEIVGPEARLIRWDGPERFDVLPLLITTDGAVAAIQLDGRRFRPNIVVGGVHQLDERTWEGRQLRIGEAVVQLHDLRGRCVMTTFDPDTQAQDMAVLRTIVRDFDGTFGLNASVVNEGSLSVGDPVQAV